MRVVVVLIFYFNRARMKSGGLSTMKCVLTENVGFTISPFYPVWGKILQKELNSFL